jgi:hypothetical protein
VVDIGSLFPGSDTGAYALNDADVVVGNSGTGTLYVGSEVMHAFRWTRAGGMIDLTPDLPASAGGSQARSINNSGAIVGQMGGTPFLYLDGHLYDLKSVVTTDLSQMMSP